GAPATPQPDGAPIVARRRWQSCQSTRKTDGDPCRAGATARSGYTRCPFHEDLPEDVKLGWRAKSLAVLASKRIVPSAPHPHVDPAGVAVFAAEVSGRLLRGEITASTAHALNMLAKTAMSAHEAAKLVELEARVK